MCDLGVTKLSYHRRATHLGEVATQCAARLGCKLDEDPAAIVRIRAADKQPFAYHRFQPAKRSRRGHSGAMHKLETGTRR